ncbi:MAG: DUF4145 domain-containing protein [Niabella sp.]
MKKIKVSKELILVCPHCGNKTGHFLLCETASRSTGHGINGPLDTFDFDCTYYLTQCKTCSGVALYYDCEFDERPGYITEATLCYPSTKTPNKDVPELIIETYREALKVEKISYTAFALLIRKTLELLCKDQKAIGSNLKLQIDDLVKKGIIPQTLSQMADTLRILGNLGAHDGSYQLIYPEIYDMKDFITAMLEYVYVAPAKIKKLKESIAKRKGSL